MATLALVLGVCTGLVIGAAERHRLRQERDAALKQSEWLAGLLAKKSNGLCGCNAGSPMSLGIEPADAEALYRELGGEGG